MPDDRPTRSFTTEIRIKAPIAEVWKAITEAEEIVKWFAVEAKVAPGAGGSIWVSWGSGMEGASQIEVWEPSRHLRLRTERKAPMGGTSVEGTPPVVLVTDYYLEAHGNETVLRLVHSGFATTSDWDGEYDGISRGWPIFLQHLRHYLERFRGQPARYAIALHAAPVSIHDAWRRVTEGLFGEGALRPGATYRATPAGMTPFVAEITVLQPPRDFGLEVTSPDPQRLHVSFTEANGTTHVVAELVVYGPAAEHVAAVEGRWTAFLTASLPAAS